MTGRGLLFRTVVGALILATGTLTAIAQEAVRLRAWRHSDFARMVFDWPSSVGYSAAVEGQVLTMRFDRPLQTDLTPVRERLGDYIAGASIGPNGQVLTFQLTAPMVLGQFANENSIVIDLRFAPDGIRTARAESPVQAPAAAVPPDGAVTLGVRVGEHPDYTRIVFDWTQQTEYDVSRDGRAVTVNFGRAAVIDAAAVAAALPPGILLAASGASEGGTRVTFAVPESADLRHFLLESRVVLDILAPAGIRNAVARPLPADQVPPVADTASDFEPKPEAAPALVPEPAPETAESSPEPAPDAAPAESDTARAKSAGTKAEVKATGAGTQTEAGAPAQPLFEYRFPFPEEIGAAVFRRGDTIWMIFDYPGSPANLTELRTKGAPAVKRLDQLPGINAMALRASIPDHRVNARVRRDGFTWVVDFVVGPQKPRNQVPIDVDVTADIGPHLSMPSNVPGRALNVPDPDMQDSMRVATFLEPGTGIDGLRRYPEFELLPTAQGVALIRLSDQVLLDRNFDGFQISTPDGLAISGVAPEAPVSSGPILSARRLFDLTGLMRGPDSEFEHQRLALFRSLAEVPDEKLDAVRLAYAGFMMAHGRGHEALGILRVVRRHNEKLMKRPENLALEAAASLLARRGGDALELLNDRRLDGFAETAIWRGAALAMEGKSKSAHDAFGAGDSLLDRYPYPLKATLGLIRIETAFQNRDMAAARSWIDVLEQDRMALLASQRAELDYHRGRLAYALNDVDLAKDLFLNVMNGGDRKWAYFAERAYIVMALKQGLIDDAEALERYERLRYAWRGGPEELSLLRRLGELYFEQPDYFKGLETYRTAVRHFPETPQAKELAGKMAQIFTDLFLNGKADSMPPLRAIALYEEFKELSPAGPQDDRLIENIADRLAAIDLLPEAAQKLEDLLANEGRIPPGDERLRLTSKLAFLYLRNDQPEKAEATLGSDFLNANLSDLDPALTADRRRLLARAKYQRGQYDRAIRELAGDVSVEADLIRRDLYRKTENWQESAKVLQRLAGNPPEDAAAGIGGQTARYVIGWAVALFQNGDQEGLEDLIDLWGPAMANNPLSGVFDYITDRNRGPSDGDVLTTVDRLIGAERFDAFMAAYQDRLFAPTEPATVEASARSF